MTALAQSLAAGVGALAVVGGESLSYGGASVVALIDRKPPKAKIDRLSFKDGKLDFSASQMTIVEVLTTAMASQPVAGKFFGDSVGFQHRVVHVERTESTWVCYCQQSQVPS